jgi:putative thioredoxin
MIFDVSEGDFETRVIERSRELPVVVDFWAAWCGPCRVLGPAIEKAVEARQGKVDLAKLDVDANQALAASFGIRGIPAVKAFRDGQVASEFTGAIPPAQVERFLDDLVPSPADELADADDETSLRRALELDPDHAEAARKLGRLLIGRGELDAARELLERVPADFVADGLVARLQLEAEADTDGASPETLRRAFTAWDSGDRAGALEALQEAFAAAHEREVRDEIRRVMVAIFTELGADDPLAREHRRRLAAALN